MKYINFKRVKIQNFLSVGNEPVVVDFKTGLNVITGVNRDKEDRRNGVGKSTVADAIYFAIYGNTLRELKKEHIPNHVTQDTTAVELEFNINNNGSISEYKIVRTLGPSKCYIYIDDVDKTRDSISNTTKYITRIINSSPEVFQNCIIMTINNTVPFMAKKKIEKRKFIEGIFNLQVFSDMLSHIRTEYNDILRSFDIECAKYEEISNTLKSYIDQKESTDKESHGQKERLEYRRECNNTSIKELQQKSSSIELDKNIQLVEEKISQLDKSKTDVRNKIDTYNTKLGAINSSITFTKDSLDKIGTGEDSCPVCLQSIDDSHRDHIETEKEKLRTKASELDEERLTALQKIEKANNVLTVVNESINKCNSKILKYKLDAQEVENVKIQIDKLNEVNSQISSDIKRLSTDTTSIDKLIASTDKRLSTAQVGIDDIKKELARLDIAKFVVSEEGVKSYIVKKILQLFNSKLSYYLKKMDANCVCVFNEYFEEEIIDEKGKICSYFNFSGAERKNIDLACLFAFMDIRRLQGDVAFNFSVYDELFDSSLDERGVELVIDILKERVEKYNECIMVISHRKESAKIAQGEVIYLEKTGGITKRVEYTVN